MKETWVLNHGSRNNFILLFVYWIEESLDLRLSCGFRITSHKKYSAIPFIT